MIESRRSVSGPGRRREETVKPRSSRARAFAGTLAFVFGLAMATPVAAGQLPPVHGAPQAPLAAAAAARVHALTPSQLASVTPQATDAAPSTSSPSFFKTGKGVAVLVLLAAGVGYTAYSAVHDRNPVKSPIR
jgi:hypothetical protein